MPGTHSRTCTLSVPGQSGDFRFGERQKRTFPKLFLALSRDVGTGSCHRASDALHRCKSGTGLASGITSAAPGIILVIAALSLIHCQTFGPATTTSAWTVRWLARSLTCIASVYVKQIVAISTRH